MKDTSIGAVAKFSCNQGYRLIGEASIICHNSGQWSRAKPSCRKIGKKMLHINCVCVHDYACYDSICLHSFIGGVTVVGMVETKQRSALGYLAI